MNYFKSFFVGFTVVLLFFALYLAPSSVFAANLINNSSLEISTSSNFPQGWGNNKYGTNTAYFSYLNGDGQDGSRSLYIDMTSWSSGDAKWYFNDVSVFPNTKYYFSNYYKSSVSTDLVVRLTDTSGRLSYVWLKSLPPSGSWTKSEAYYLTPSYAKSITVFHIIGSVGYLQTDSFVFEQSSEVSSTPTPTPSSTTVYYDSLQNGWQNWSYGSTVNLSDNSSPYSGSNNISWKINNPWGGLQFAHSGFDTSGYGSLSFAVKATASNPNIGIEIYSGDNIRLSRHSLDEFGGQPFVGSYKTYNIPLSVLNADNKTITKINILDFLGSSQPVFYVDMIAFVSLTFGRPTPTPTPAPSPSSQALLTLTFDDGLKSQITNGWPLLQKYGLKGTFYIVTGFLGYNLYMVPGDVVTLYKGGNEIGSHTVSHPDLRTLSYDQVEMQLSSSKTYLQNLLGTSINNFCTPYGRYNSTILSQIGKYYSSHRTTVPGFNYKDSLKKYELKVQNVLNTTTSGEVAGWIQEAKDTNGLLILVYHSIVSNPDTYSTTPQKFDSQLNVIKESGIKVVTLEEALRTFSL